MRYFVVLFVKYYYFCTHVSIKLNNNKFSEYNYEENCDFLRRSLRCISIGKLWFKQGERLS